MLTITQPSGALRVWESMSVVLVLAVVAVLAVVGVLVFALRRKRRSCVVLYGPCGSGKTALWYRLKTGKFLSTVSSMKENEGTFPWGEDESQQPRHTVDIPGEKKTKRVSVELSAVQVTGGCAGG